MPNQLTKKERQMSIKEMQFVTYVLREVPKAEAYKAVYECGDWSKGVITKKANALWDKANVQDFVKRIETKATEIAGMDEAEKRLILRDIARDPDNQNRDRIAAIKADNDLAGHGSTRKVEVEHKSTQLSDLMEKIRSEGSRVPMRRAETPYELLEQEAIEVTVDES